MLGPGPWPRSLGSRRPLLSLYLYQSAGLAIIAAFPFTLYFHSPLRSGIAKARIASGERRFAVCFDQLHADARLFVGWRAGHLVGATAGEAVHRFLNRVHRHVEFVALDAIGDQRAHANATEA